MSDAIDRLAGRGSDGLNGSFSDTNNDLALFGLVTSLGLVAAVMSFFLPVRWYVGWVAGYLALGPLAGLCFGFTIMLFGGTLIYNTAGRWALSGIFAMLGLVGVLTTRWRGTVRWLHSRELGPVLNDICPQMMSCCLIGAFMLALGIDLVVNANRGTSLGLRKMLDSNDLHRAVGLLAGWTLRVQR